MYVDIISTRGGDNQQPGKDKDFRFAHKRYRPKDPKVDVSRQSTASRVLQTGQLREHGSHIGYAGVRRATALVLCITLGCHSKTYYNRPRLKVGQGRHCYMWHGTIVRE